MDFQGLSEVSRPAEISGAGYPPPPAGKTSHDFVLIVNVRRFLVPVINGVGRQPTSLSRRDFVAVGGRQLVPTWTWLVHGYRGTGKTLQIGGKTFQIFDPAPGSFGYVAQHGGPQTDELSFHLSGPGLERRGDGMYALSVPHGGAVTLSTTVSAGPTQKGCLWILVAL